MTEFILYMVWIRDHKPYEDSPWEWIMQQIQQGVPPYASFSLYGKLTDRSILDLSKPFIRARQSVWMDVLECCQYTKIIQTRRYVVENQLTVERF